MPAVVDESADDAHCQSEQALLLSQANEQGGVPLRAPQLLSARRRLLPVASRLWSAPSRLSFAAAMKVCRAGAVRRKWAGGLLVAALLLSMLLYPCLVADSHGRWQLLAVRLVTVTKALDEWSAEVAWDVNWLLLSFGSRLRACQLDTSADGESGLKLALQHSAGRFTDELLTESAGGQSYVLSSAAPLLFSPSYRPSASSPHAQARVLACSTSSRRCDEAVVNLFQDDLVAEVASNASFLPNFCPALMSTETADSCARWPFSAGSSSETSATAMLGDGGEADCGSGAVNMQESLHWWYYRHPMSCMQLARSIGSRHNYCAGRDRHVDEQRVNFHIAMFGPVWRTQATLAVSSFLLTQNLSQSHLFIWTDRALSAVRGVEDVQPLLSAASQHVDVRVWNAYDELVASNSLLASSAAWYATVDDSKGYLNGDLMRLLLLHNYGGVWMDADVLLLRDLSPILGQQFFYKWGGHCDEFNGAVVRMFKGSVLSSRFLDALYHTPPRANSVDWGNSLYAFIHSSQRASLDQSHNHRPPAQPTAASLRSEHFTVFPACFFNPNWMEPAAFSPIRRPELPQSWPSLWHGPFAYHLHGEVWDERGFAARDPTYQHVAARLTALTRQKWQLV